MFWLALIVIVISVISVVGIFSDNEGEI